MKKIDIHAHLTAFPEYCPPDPNNNQRFLTADELLSMYDELGIERGVILPITSPDGELVVLSNESAAYLAGKYPDRLSWFCNVDPRAMENTSASRIGYLLEWYKSLGAKGVGEFTSNLYADDPLTDHLLDICGELDMPVLIHIAPKFGGYYGMIDDLGLPRIEKELRLHPKLKIIGHSQFFWSEISADNSDEIRGSYPSGKIVEGRIAKLMREYPNLYCDLSAGSGSNAMMRDPEYAVSFMTEFADRIYYGCDICAATNRHQFIFRDFLDGLYDSSALPKDVYEKIVRKNAEKLLGLQ